MKRWFIPRTTVREENRELDRIALKKYTELMIEVFDKYHAVQS